jgi:hypothetical protein
MGLLVLHGRDHAKGRVESAVVVPVDPAGGGVLDVGEGLVRPVVEDGGTNAFGLEQADDRQMAHAAVVVGARSGTTTCAAPALAAVVVVPVPPWCTTGARDHRRSGQRNHRHRRSRPGHASGTPLKIKRWEERSSLQPRSRFSDRTVKYIDSPCDCLARRLARPDPRKFSGSEARLNKLKGPHHDQADQRQRAGLEAINWK